MHAVILAAGRGTRMRPLSVLTPKPMLPVGDRPLVAHVADAAVEAGADGLVFVVPSRDGHLGAHFGDSYRGVPVEYAVQPAAEGTAAAVRAASDLVDGRFAVMNGDSLFEPAAVDRLFDHEVAVLAHRVDDPGEYGVLSTDGSRVTGVVEKPDDPPTNLANAGAYVLPGDVRDAFDVPVSDRGEDEITDALETVLGRYDVAAVETGRWRDVARPGDLVAANRSVLAEGVVADGGAVAPDRRDDGVRVAPGADVADSATVEGPALICAGAVVEPDAVVRGRCVVGADATVGAGAELAGSVLFPGASVGPRSLLAGVVLGPRPDLSAHACVTGGVDAHETTSVVATHGELDGPLAY